MKNWNSIIHRSRFSLGAANFLTSEFSFKKCVWLQRSHSKKKKHTSHRDERQTDCHEYPTNKKCVQNLCEVSAFKLVTQPSNAEKEEEEEEGKGEEE